MTKVPSEFSFDEIEIGQKFSFNEKISEQMVNDFAKLSGDYNPLHIDEKYASSTDFKKRICHGLLLASFFSRLIGMHLPGKNSLYFSQKTNFQSPCFINDKIVVEGEISDKSPATKIVTISTKIFRNDGECLVNGEAKVIIR